MASLQALAIQANEALDRIVARSEELHALGLCPAPLENVRRVHQDREQLRVAQLVTIAEWLDTVTVEISAQAENSAVELPELPPVELPVKKGK